MIGRFTQEDTYRRDGLNLYAYCDNNPVMYYDPSGHIQEKYDDGYNAAGKTRSEEINDNNLNVNGKRQGIEGGSDTNVSADWGYAQNQSSVTGCQNIASRALEEGYSVIKVQSYRCDGINYIIYDNFEEILSSQMATPVKPSEEK